jgi:hypothetical protein
MPRVDLSVPFAEKDDAKRLGARWDAVNKVWYVPEGIDPALFGRWLPQEPASNLRATGYFIAQSMVPCWKCGKLTQVFSFLLPAGHETLEEIECEGSDKVEAVWVKWVRVDAPTIVLYVDYLSSFVSNRRRPPGMVSRLSA